MIKMLDYNYGVPNIIIKNIKKIIHKRSNQQGKHCQKAWFNI